MSDRALLSAATLAATTAVSLREPGLPDEPFGVRFPGQVAWPRRTCAVLSATVLVGTLAEPASWGLRPRSRSAGAMVPLLLLSGAALFVAGTRDSRTPA